MKTLLSKGRITVGINVQFWWDEDINVYVGHCEGLNIFSQGETIQECEEALTSAVSLYLKYVKP